MLSIGFLIYLNFRCEIWLYAYITSQAIIANILIAQLVYPAWFANKLHCKVNKSFSQNKYDLQLVRGGQSKANVSRGIRQLRRGFGKIGGDDSYIWVPYYREGQIAKMHNPF